MRDPVTDGSDNDEMDNRRLEELILELTNADPAEAPDLADVVVEELTDLLEGRREETD